MACSSIAPPMTRPKCLDPQLRQRNICNLLPFLIVFLVVVIMERLPIVTVASVGSGHSAEAVSLVSNQLSCGQWYGLCWGNASLSGVEESAYQAQLLPSRSSHRLLILSHYNVIRMRLQLPRLVSVLDDLVLQTSRPSPSSRFESALGTR